MEKIDGQCSYVKCYIINIYIMNIYNVYLECKFSTKKKKKRTIEVISFYS